MTSERTVGLGLVGAAVTLLARKATRRIMHDGSGRRRLPRAAGRSGRVAMLLIMSVASGALLALGEVLHEHRRHLADAN